MGQVIMPEILSDHDLNWGGSGTPVQGGTYYASTSTQNIINQAGDYSVQNAIKIAPLSFINLTAANIKSGETITVTSGSTTWSFGPGTGGSAGTGGYKLKILTNIQKVPAQDPATGGIPVLPDISDATMISKWGNCTYILISDTDISDITPSYVLAVPDLSVNNSDEWRGLGGGFIRMDQRQGSIEDGSPWSGRYLLDDNQSVVWCNNTSGIKMPVSTGQSEYYDSDDDEYYRTRGPEKYMVFVVGTPR